MDSSDAEVIARSLVDSAAFGALFDRHAAVLYRYLVRRVGPDAADGMLGDLFRIAFERRSTYDGCRPSARPWLYGIANHLLSKHHRSEARRLRATALLAARSTTPEDPTDRVPAAIDARGMWPRVAEAIASLPEGERDALLLLVWEELSYEDIAGALGVPVGTVRSRLNRARRRLRDLTGHTVELQEQTPMTDELDPVRELRPDRLLADDPPDPEVLTGEKHRLLSSITGREDATRPATPSIYTRLAYLDERAALEFLTRAFGLRERREARMEYPDGMLAWLEVGDGVVMIGRGGAERHDLYSPAETGRTTAMVNVYVDDVDAHYRAAVAEGARIVMELEDMFWGDRRYEALDPEGHRWHFGERLSDVRRREAPIAAPNPEAVPSPPVGSPRILAHLIYDDVAGAITWLTEAFGFRERTAARHTSPDGTVARTQMEVMDSLITIGEPSIHGESPRRGVSSMLYVYVDDVDGHYRRAVAAGATIVSEPDDLPWGDRRYQATDPEGHQWSFARTIRVVGPGH